ncbi:hypothetical protein CSKR_106545 [Clonorchis sinensis]|uniref:Uncharacterized protein n=1 Tax=Clonorchis sinensis TaxID=79923 RepID=A0A3R7GAM7_CLOSI|nr:hypothetical protein CSKR_106545 [Clonorchis sinensis]
MMRPGAAHSVAWNHHKREIQLGSNETLMSLIIFVVVNSKSVFSFDALQPEFVRKSCFEGKKGTDVQEIRIESDNKNTVNLVSSRILLHGGDLTYSIREGDSHRQYPNFSQSPSAGSKVDHLPNATHVSC